MSVRGCSPSPSTHVAAAARRAELGRHLGSEAEPNTKARTGGLLAVAACLVAICGYLLAFAADPAPFGARWVLSSAVLIVGGLGFTAGWLSRSGAVVHCYEHGAVVEPGPGRGPLQAFHRTRLLPYEWILPGTGDGVPVLALRTSGSDGSRIARYSGAQAVRLAELLVVWELPHALDRLAGGSHLRYGEVLISREALELRDLMLPWARIRGIRPHGGELLVYVRDMEHPVASVDAGRTPHRRTLQALAMHLVTGPGLAQPGLPSNEPR